MRHFALDEPERLEAEARQVSLSVRTGENLIMVANKAARLLIRRLELYGNLSDDDKAVLLGMDAAQIAALEAKQAI